MFDIRFNESGAVVLSGRFDATQADVAREELEKVAGNCVVDFEDLEYISSAGLGVLLGVQKRLKQSGNSMKLVGFNKHIREIFKIAGFDQVFDIE